MWWGLEFDEGVARKHTAIGTTKKALLDHFLPQQCDRQHDDVTLEGGEPGKGVRTRYAENYPQPRAALLADALLYKEEQDACFYTAGEAMDDEDQAVDPPAMDAEDQEGHHHT